MEHDFYSYTVDKNVETIYTGEEWLGLEKKHNSLDEINFRHILVNFMF